MQSQKSRFVRTVLTAFALFSFSVARVVPAYADETAPPPEETLLVEEPTTQVPEGTDPAVVDQHGNALPLATQQAADAIIEKDPMWCPSGVAPKANTSGCSGSFGSLNLLVTGFVPPAKNGTIWIEAGTDLQSGGNVVIHGAGTWTPAANYSLTLQGGWIGGITGSKAIIGTSLFDSAINIVAWNGAVNVYDIALVGASNAYEPGTGAINIKTTKSITLGNVLVANSTGGSTDGIYLDNSSSTTEAFVTIKNSAFNGNQYRGISIYSNGAITLTNVTANNNLSRGAYIDGDSNNDSAASVITISNSIFNNNAADGLSIVGNGAVKLHQVNASWNITGSGVKVDNSFATAAQGITGTGFLIANDNGATGLFIEKSKGAVSLINLTTNDNNVNGTSINNTLGITPAAVTINGINFFNDNSSTGLVIYSKGAITTNNLTAISNNGNGVELDNTYGSVPMAVKMNGSNFFDENDEYGLWIESFGAITTNNITALRNGVVGGDLHGAYIYNNYDPAKPFDITMNGTNVFNDNSNYGLYVLSYGNVTINNITASFNGDDVTNATGNGVQIDNTGSLTPKSVTLKGINVFDENEKDGLVIYSYGAITVSNVTSYYNSQGWGVYLDNSGPFQSPISITGYGHFHYNDQDGLYASSNGSITTSNLTSSGNDGSGVYLYTIGITKPQTVSMKGNNFFQYNGDISGESGLRVYADGNITVNNLRANNNFTNGATLDNFANWNLPATNFTTFGSILLTGFNSFTDNATDGLNVYTHGALVLNNVTSSYNGDDGISINADGKVTLVCALAANNAYGVYVYTNTPLLTIKGLLAYGNTSLNEILSYTTISRTRCP